MSATIVNPGPEPAPTDDDEDAEFVALDAEAAYHGVSALVEMLGACKPSEQVTGIFIHSLLLDVRMHLENVVSNMRVPQSAMSSEPQQFQQ